MKRTVALIALAAASVGITSCSPPAPNEHGSSASQTAQTGSSAVAPTPTRTAMPAGAFDLVPKTGGIVRFTLPTPVSDPAVADIEAFRKKTGAAPVSYIVADVDNRNGTDVINMYRLSAYDADGKEYSFVRAATVVADWRPSFGSDYFYHLRDGSTLDEKTGTALYNEGVALNNAIDIVASPAQRANIVLISKATDLPKEFTRVAVSPSGMGTPIEAVPSGAGGHD